MRRLQLLCLLLRLSNLSKDVMGAIMAKPSDTTGIDRQLEVNGNNLKERLIESRQGAQEHRKAQAESDWNAEYVTDCLDGKTVGYDDWSSLIYDTTNAALSGNIGGTFILCPNTVFNEESDDDDNPWLQLFSSNMVIKCGDDGSRSNNCIIRWRENGIATGEGLDGMDPPTGIEIIGLTFDGSNQDYESSGTAIVATSFGNQILIRDCIFRNAASDALDSARIGVYAFTGATVEIRDSIFQNNKLGALAVALGGTLIIEETIFESNTVLFSDGMVPAISGGSVWMSASCFFNNTLPGSEGLVFIDQMSSGSIGNDNKGSNTVMTSQSTPFCNGMFIDSTQNCQEFDDEDCLVQSYPHTEAPTSIIDDDHSGLLMEETPPSSAPDNPWVAKAGPSAVPTTQDNSDASIVSPDNVPPMRYTFVTTQSSSTGLHLNYLYVGAVVSYLIRSLF